MPKIKLPERSSALVSLSGNHNSVSSLALADGVLTSHLRLVCWLLFHVPTAFPLTLHTPHITVWPARWYQFESTCLVCKLSWPRFNIISLKPGWINRSQLSVGIIHTHTAKPAWSYSKNGAKGLAPLWKCPAGHDQRLETFNFMNRTATMLPLWVAYRGTSWIFQFRMPLIYVWVFNLI